MWHDVIGLKPILRTMEVEVTRQMNWLASYWIKVHLVITFQRNKARSLAHQRRDPCISGVVRLRHFQMEALGFEKFFQSNSIQLVAFLLQ